MNQQELANVIRGKVEQHNSLVAELDTLFRQAKREGLEIELMDGVNSEVSHDLDGFTAFKLRIVKILAKMPL